MYEGIGIWFCRASVPELRLELQSVRFVQNKKTSKNYHLQWLRKIQKEQLKKVCVFTFVVVKNTYISAKARPES